MAMSMQELFYGGSEPAYLVQYGRQTSSVPYSRAYQVQLPEARSRRMELSTFDLMVPMCCTQCEDQVREALLALGNVRDVVCDPRNQRVTVTGCLDPAQALKQVRRVKNGATFGSSNSAHRYELSSSYQNSHRHIQQDNRSRSSYVQLDTREQRSQYYPGQYNNRSSSSDAYSRSLCPAYRDSTVTHYINVNPKIATRVEMEC